ncbi:hypothetical protein QQG55_37690 [Brugia pahangi]|uniref:DNA_pol_E_B domain-containing protein n=1 Tax=Brugia pahangi TaxID=6280 RepID=A0A0N4TT87_BRUPA|nr:unnamed protein product [Brugia pahangi]
MADDIKSKVEKKGEEEEEEEEEDSVIDVRHRKFVYKVQFVQSPDHPTTSLHMTTQNASSSSANSSGMMKMDDSNQYFSNESLIPRNIEHLALSLNNNSNRQQNSIPTITFNEAEQCSTFVDQMDILNNMKEYHSEQQMINLTEPFQQFNPSNDEKISNGTLLDNTFNREFGASFTISNDFEMSNTDNIHYDEMLSNILQHDDSNNISCIQHAPLFGYTTGNLFNFTISDFNLSDPNIADDVKQTFTDDYHSGKPIIMGLMQNGQIIVDGLSMAINKKLSSKEENESIINEGVISSLSILSQNLDDYLNEQHENVKQINSNEVISGITVNGELIIANRTTDNSLPITKHLATIIMGLTANGQIIVGGCMSNAITENPLGKFNEQNHVTIDIIGNITAKNEKVLIGLTTTNSNFTNVHNESLLRRDSF